MAAIASGAVVAIPGAPGGEVATAQTRAPERPNVVVVMTDDQDAASMRVMPTLLRELVRRGTTFGNAFASFPQCCPSRATFLTGQYAHNHGVMSNAPPSGGYAKFKGAVGTLPIAVDRAGYRTGFVGKYLSGYSGTGAREIPAGWDQWFAVTGGTRSVKMFNWELLENGRVRRYGRRARDYQTDVFARKAVGFIRQSARGRAPFFLTVAPGAPHEEAGTRRRNPRPAPRHRHRFDDVRQATPPSYNEADVSDKPSLARVAPLSRREHIDIRERYGDRLASLLSVDDAVGRILAELRRTGELSNTIVVFTSDNGYLQGEHRLRRKSVLYEESARVPLVIRGPGVPRGATSPQLVSNIDLAPTIIDAADATPGRLLDGQSLMPFSRRGPEERELLLENQRSAAVRTSRYMYAEHPSGESELYDLYADPFQLESRHADPQLAGVREDLAERLSVLRDCAGPTCR